MRNTEGEADRAHFDPFSTAVSSVGSIARGSCPTPARSPVVNSTMPVGLTAVAGDVLADSRTGRNASRWTRLSSRGFHQNAVLLQLHALVYNLANCMRTLASPVAVGQWSLTTLREKPIKIGAKIVHHGRYVVFQRAGVAIPHDLFADILCRINRLRPTRAPA